MSREKEKKKESQACERCGRPDAHPFGAHWLCDECYHERSSSDLEEGGDDEWQEEPQKKAA